MDSQFTQLMANWAQILQQLTAINSELEMNWTRLEITRWNTSARNINYLVPDNNSPLVPLHHYQTNEEIPNFPDTPGSIQHLNSNSYPLPIHYPSIP